MSWAMVKHALNSSLGRKDFMPLNEQINSLRTLYASDEVYYTQSISNIKFTGNIEGEETIPLKIKMTCDGTLYFSLYYESYIHDRYSNEIYYWYIFKNDELLETFDIVANGSGFATGKTQLITFNNGDVFSFKVYYRGRYGDSSLEPISISMLGTIKENNVMKII